MPGLFSGSILLLFLLQSISFNLVPDVKHVLTPALLKERLRRYEMPPGINGMRANGLYSSSLKLSSLNGKTSNHVSKVLFQASVISIELYAFEC